MGDKPFHENFSPSSKVEHSYSMLKVTHKPNKQGFNMRDILPENLIFGITIHASERMKQRNITKDMVAHTIKYGNIFKEPPQKKWDGQGRKLFMMNGMVVVTNFDQNRIVTVYWKIKDWSYIDNNKKKIKQNYIRKCWIKKFLL